MRAAHTQSKVRLPCFLRLAQPWKQNSCSPKLLASREEDCRCLLLQCHAPPQSLCTTLFVWFIKGPLKDTWGLFAFGFYFGLLVLGFFGVGSFWKGKECLKRGW
jgi:hypothetical protein